MKRRNTNVPHKSVVDKYRRIMRKERPYRCEIILPENFKPGSEEFNLLRCGSHGVRIGGSECATAIGYGSFKSVEELWKEKVELKKWYLGGRKAEEKPENKKRQEELVKNPMLFVQLTEGQIRETEMTEWFSKLTGFEVLPGNYWTFNLHPLSKYFGVLPDGKVMLKKGNENDFCPLELKVSIYVNCEYLLLDHACQCFYQMWAMGSKECFYQNCHYSETRVREDGVILKRIDKKPVSTFLFKIYWNDEFWEWMKEGLLNFANAVIDEEEPISFHNEDKILPPILHGLDFIQGECVTFPWKKQYERIVSYPSYPTSYFE
jgi:hypothetical protein